MVAVAIMAAVPLIVVAAIVTVAVLLPSHVRAAIAWRLELLCALFRRRDHPSTARRFNMTTKARRVRFTSTEMDIKDWDLVHVKDRKMVVHHTTLILFMGIIVTVIFVTGETAGAIATGALASQDGFVLIRDLLNRQ